MKKFGFIILLIWGSTAMVAQPDEKTFNLTQLLDSALKNNYILKANEQNVFIKQTEIEMLKTNYQPTISTSASFSYWRWLLPRQERVLGDALTYMYTDIEIHQTLYDWGENKTKKTVVEQEIKLNDEIRRQIKHTVIWGVSHAYFEVMKAKAVIRTYQNSLQQLQSQLQYAINLQRLGKASNVDILKIKVQISVEEKNMEKAEYELKNRLISIKRLCYLNIQEDIAIEDLSKELYHQTQNQIFFADTIYNKVRHNHPELAVRDKEIIIESKQKELLEVQSRPQIFTYGIATWEHGYIPFGNNFNYNIGVGIRYTIPHWGGSSFKAKMVQSEYRIEQIENEKSQQFVDLKRNIDATTNRLEGIKKEIDRNEIIIEMAGETYNNASVKYRAGQGSIIDILDAQEILINATLEHEKSTINYLQELARLHYLSGEDSYPF